MNVSGWVLIVLLLLAGFFWVGASSEVEVATVEALPVMATREVRINGNPGVILESRSGEGWTPAEEHLQAAEDAVSMAAPGFEPSPVLEGYRQYTGMMEDGERKILIFSMCQEIEGWRTDPVMVADGGPCFWEAMYNVETDELESLVVNGEA